VLLVSSCSCNQTGSPAILSDSSRQRSYLLRSSLYMLSAFTFLGSSKFGVASMPLSSSSTFRVRVVAFQKAGSIVGKKRHHRLGCSGGKSGGSIGLLQLILLEACSTHRLIKRNPRRLVRVLGWKLNGKAKRATFEGGGGRHKKNFPRKLILANNDILDETGHICFQFYQLFLYTICHC